nr:unnamed protein product [Callosobruchus analis]
MKTKNDQDIYLQGMIEAVTIKQRRKLNGKKIKVCQNVFLTVHGVSAERMKRIKKLLCLNETPCARRVYYYRQFFHENFNLRFGRPQVDTCTKCEELTLKVKSSTLENAAKKAAVVEKMVHEQCKQRNDLGVICFDYMQNLQLPFIPVQDVFYLTQLTVSLFCIHDMKSDKSYFYINPENAAAKSPNEIDNFELTADDNDASETDDYPMDSYYEPQPQEYRDDTPQEVNFQNDPLLDRPPLELFEDMSEMVMDEVYPRAHSPQDELPLALIEDMSEMAMLDDEPSPQVQPTDINELARHIQALNLDNTSAIAEADQMFL